MRKIYNIKNIHCADCARSLEEAIGAMKDVKYVKLNFLTEKLDIDINDEAYESVFADVKKLIRDFSRNVELYEDVQRDASNLGVTSELRFSLRGQLDLDDAKKVERGLERLTFVVFAEIQGKELLVKTDGSGNAVSNRIKSLIHSLAPSLKIKEITATHKSKGVGCKLLMYLLGLLLAVPVILSEYGLVTMPGWTINILLMASALAFGYSTYYTAIKMLFRLNINENLLVTISVFGAIIIGERIEGLMVIALYTLGKMLESKAVNKSRKQIQDLLDINPEYAVVLRDGKEIRVKPESVKVGETIIVRPGEKVALDGEVVCGACNVNAQSLTGEMAPIYKASGSEILSGVVVLDGVLEIKVVKPIEESTSTKIVNLIEKASENKSKTETFISKFAKYYTLMVVVLAAAVATATGLILGDWVAAVYRGLVFLVISCPCAFAISVPLTYFSGIGNASKRGILIKGSNYLDVCTKAKIVAFDKTGTLTTGEFAITKIEVFEDAYTEDEIVEIAAIGEQYSIHPLAKTIKDRVCDKTLPKVESYHEQAGVGISFDLDGTTYFVGRAEDDSASTEVAIKKGNILLGVIHFEDKLKPTSISATRQLRSMGIHTAMLTGDKAEVAQKVAKEFNETDVHAELLPQDKYNWIEKEKALCEKGEKLIYVGDGINDAPSLALADVGVGMGLKGSGASIEAADVVLVDDDPEKMVELVKIAKYTKKIVVQNIVFASVIKICCLALGAFGIAKMIMAVFADVGVTILAVLNSLRALKYDANRNKK